MSKLTLLELVALQRDIPEQDLREGDVGTVVEVLNSAAVIVEFMEASGHTRAVLTLPVSDVRRVEPHEMLAVRGGKTVSGKP
ncbi:MAG: DUF4926 domain-containing protein [Chloroflexi bacterium]|nr:DUF4926 domain-containing protein [Chloroflexota bacterium]